MLLEARPKTLWMPRPPSIQAPRGPPTARHRASAPRVPGPCRGTAATLTHRGLPTQLPTGTEPRTLGPAGPCCLCRGLQTVWLGEAPWYCPCGSAGRVGGWEGGRGPAPAPAPAQLSPLCTTSASSGPHGTTRFHRAADNQGGSPWGQGPGRLGPLGRAATSTPDVRSLGSSRRGNCEWGPPPSRLKSPSLLRVLGSCGSGADAGSGAQPHDTAPVCCSACSPPGSGLLPSPCAPPPSLPCPGPLGARATDRWGQANAGRDPRATLEPVGVAPTMDMPGEADGKPSQAALPPLCLPVRVCVSTGP